MAVASTRLMCGPLPPPVKESHSPIIIPSNRLHLSLQVLIWVAFVIIIIYFFSFSFKIGLYVIIVVQLSFCVIRSLKICDLFMLFICPFFSPEKENMQLLLLEVVGQDFLLKINFLS